MAELLRGKPVADAINLELRSRMHMLTKNGVTPVLGILRIGESPDDIAYERGAIKRAETVGISVRQYLLSEDISPEALLSSIYDINNDKTVHGVLLLMNAADSATKEKARNALSPEKDADGVSDISHAGVYSGEDKGYPPCTAAACIEILKYYGIDLRGKRAAVIGRSLIIGRPVTMMLIKEDATVTVCHTKTREMPSICSEADILIAAAGSAGMVTSEFMNESQIIVDVGINVDGNGKLSGDVEPESADESCSAYTPVPGGVGTVTSSILMKHVIEAAEKAE